MSKTKAYPWIGTMIGGALGLVVALDILGGLVAMMSEGEDLTVQAVLNSVELSCAVVGGAVAGAILGGIVCSVMKGNAKVSWKGSTHR